MKTIDEINLQAARMEGFKEGYLAALKWFLGEVPVEKSPEGNDGNPAAA